MRPVTRVFSAVCILFAILAAGQSAPAAQVDNGLLIIKNLVNGKVMPETAIKQDCRPDGYRCKSSLDCCGFCHEGVCDMGGGNSCRPDGAVCKSSLDCCGFCHEGVCGNGGGNSCRPAGLSCNSSLDCCNFCHDGVCN